MAVPPTRQFILSLDVVQKRVNGVTLSGRTPPGYGADSEYRFVLAVVDDAPEPLHINELAERLVQRDETVMGTDEYEQRLERKRIWLHHGALPRLAQDGIVQYDPETNAVSSVRARAVEVEWHEGESIDGVLSTLGADEHSGDSPIGIVEGRQAVIEYGRRLADEAADELFCMYVSTDLLEDECLCHAADAIDRGVEMYMGSRNEDVRALTRRHLPEATIWEPQRGWMNAPCGYPKLGRLVLIDRQKVMLAVLEEPSHAGAQPHETAMVGEGEDNPLVVLVRELLGPRLDHLDFQSTDFQSRLHS